MKVLVTDPLAEKGLKILRKEKGIEVEVKTGLSTKQLVESIGDCQGLIVRSGTKVTGEIIKAAKELKAIGRAGVGLDNVDVEAATEKGIIVMNAPVGNTISTAEHTVSLILALSRNITRADRSLRQKKWERKKFMGVEVYKKTLGIIGLGRVGSDVAKRMKSFGMHCLAYDPYISPEMARRIEVELVELKDLLHRADYISIHTPLTEETKHLIGEDEFKEMKKGVRVINCARGGVVDEDALYKAIKEGRVAGAALDVYEEEPPFKSPLLELDSVVLTPHLGASTEEAQVNVAIEFAQQMVDALKKGILRNAVNVPMVEPEAMEEIRPYLELAEKLGSLEGQLAQGHVVRVKVNYSGEVLDHDVQPMTVALLKGLLEPFLKETVNYVNAPLLAKRRGIKVVETKSSETQDFTNLISVELETSKLRSSAAGSLFGKSDLRIVSLDGYYLSTKPSGWILICSHEAKPGIIGKIGTILGNTKINIAGLTLGRKPSAEKELTVLNLDGKPTQKVLEDIRKIKEIFEARLVKL